MTAPLWAVIVAILIVAGGLQLAIESRSRWSFWAAPLAMILAITVIALAGSPK